MLENAAIDSLEQQLCALYQEREALAQTIGASSHDEVVSMVNSLASQLNHFYERFGSLDNSDDTDCAVLLSKINTISAALDPLYSHKSVQVSIEDARTLLRAEWTEAIEQRSEPSP